MSNNFVECHTVPCASDEKAPFIFVSYAHADAHIVFPTIDSVSVTAGVKCALVAGDIM